MMTAMDWSIACFIHKVYLQYQLICAFPFCVFTVLKVCLEKDKTVTSSVIFYWGIISLPRKEGALYELSDWRTIRASSTASVLFYCFFFSSSSAIVLFTDNMCSASRRRWSDTMAIINFASVCISVALFCAGKAISLFLNFYSWSLNV